MCQQHVYNIYVYVHMNTHPRTAFLFISAISTVIITITPVTARYTATIVTLKL